MKTSTEIPSFFRGRRAWLRAVTVGLTCLVIGYVFVLTANFAFRLHLDRGQY